MIRYVLIAVATVGVGMVAVLGLAWYALYIDTTPTHFETSRVVSLPSKAQVNPPSTQVLSFGTSTFKIEVADTHATRVRGLSGRAMLPPRTGLLFIFLDDDTHGIWMKDMRFPIDIVWLDADLRVVHIESDVSPDTFPMSFVPPVPARYVLEVNAGEASTAGIVTGSQAIVTHT